MTVSDYRAFGECQKTILVAGDTIDLTVTPQTSSVGNMAQFSTGYKFMHVLPLEESELNVTLQFDIQTATAFNITTTSQVLGVVKLQVVSGTVQVFFFI